MKYSYELGQQQFDALLTFLSPDREEAGEKYEQIRGGLVRYFDFKGCVDPQTLADETIDRVATKLRAFDPSIKVRPASYFRGFASNILLEYRRTYKEAELEENMGSVAASPVEEDAGEDQNRCLDECLEELPPDDKNLVAEYYSREKQARIDLRRRISEREHISTAALYTRICRIKSLLKDCIENCTQDSL
jgi:DNA-directed RNA polymerase specialized sigma24 family protein